MLVTFTYDGDITVFICNECGRMFAILIPEETGYFYDGKNDKPHCFKCGSKNVEEEVDIEEE